MVQAALSASTANNAAEGAQETEPVQQYIFDTEETAAILDMKALMTLPHCAGEPTDSLRLIVVPKGKCMRVPTRQGHYVVNGQWRDVEFPCWVSFLDAMKRPEELAFCVSDYGRSTPNCELVSIQSVGKPLRTANNKYRGESDVRITPYSKIKSFRPISNDVNEIGQVLPWMAQFNRYKVLGLTNIDQVREYIDISLVNKLPLVYNVAKKCVEAIAEEAGRQDPRMKDVTLSKHLAFLNGVHSGLTEELMSLYDEPLESRLLTYSENKDAEGQCSSQLLASPDRAKIKNGNAKLLQSRLVKQTIRVEEPPPAREGSEASHVNLEEILEEAAPAGDQPQGAPDELGKKPVEKSAPPPRSSVRNVIRVSRFDDMDEGPQLAKSEKRGKKRAEREAPQAFEQEKPINPRTGKPYVRGGPYSRTKESAAARNAQAFRTSSIRSEVVDLGSECSVSDAYSKLREENATLKAKVTQLEANMTVLKAENASLKEKSLLEKQLAVATQSKDDLEKQHAKFLEGLRMGQQMGQGMSFSSAQYHQPPPSYHAGGSGAEQTPVPRGSAQFSGSSSDLYYQQRRESF